MIKLRFISIFIVTAALVSGEHSSSAQQSFGKRFSAQNSAMTALQPAFITPLVAPDPRLIQYAKLSFSNEYTSTGTQTVNYGNSRGLGIIGGNRFEFDYIPPPYVQHNSSAIDGFGDTAAVVKYRIASGNAEHGDFEISAILNRCFATGGHKNGAATDTYGPALAAGFTHKKVDVISSLGGTMPTGKIATQGRTITWNALTQAHANPHVWLEIENNATFLFRRPPRWKNAELCNAGCFLRGAQQRVETYSSIPDF